MKEIVLDTETTGISVQDGHRIVEIGCIELDNLVPTKNKFHCYLNPERKVSEKAFEVHGYSDEFLSSKQKFIENSGNLYVAISLTCKIPLATKVPDNKAAGTFILSNNKIKIIDPIIRIKRLK